MNSVIKLMAMSLALAVTSPAGAVTMTTSVPATQNNNIIQIAQGCPAGMWRGPWGHCRDTPYSGPLPNNTWVGNPPPAFNYLGNGCPPGMWHGPWGHCRDTPYQGRLPDGQWKN